MAWAELSRVLSLSDVRQPFVGLLQPYCLNQLSFLLMYSFCQFCSSREPWPLQRAVFRKRFVNILRHGEAVHIRWPLTEDGWLWRTRGDYPVTWSALSLSLGNLLRKYVVRTRKTAQWLRVLVFMEDPVPTWWLQFQSMERGTGNQWIKVKVILQPQGKAHHLTGRLLGGT